MLKLKRATFVQRTFFSSGRPAYTYLSISMNRTKHIQVVQDDVSAGAATVATVLDSGIY